MALETPRLPLGTSRAVLGKFPRALTVSGRRVDHIHDLRMDFDWPAKLRHLWNACNAAEMLAQSLEDALRVDRLALASVDLDMEVMEARASHLLSDVEAEAWPHFVAFYTERGDMQ